MGFVVERRDFITAREDSVPHCPAGHPQVGSDPFCSKDGGPFIIRKIEHPTEVLRKLCEIHKLTLPVSGKELDDFYQSLFDGNEPFLAVGYHHDRRTFAGSMISDLTYEGRRNHSEIPIAEVTRNIKRVEQFRSDLGVGERAIYVHHVLGNPDAF